MAGMIQFTSAQQQSHSTSWRHESGLENQEWWVKTTFDPVYVHYGVCLLYAPCLQYLESVHPLLNDKDYQEMERLVEDFKV